MLGLGKRDFTDTVAVLDADAPPGLAFTRSLGRSNIGVLVYSPKAYPVARLSRYCTGFARCPDPEDTETFLPWLRQASERGHFSLVAPTSDLMAFYMAEFPEVFPPGQAAAMPSRQSILNMLFKDRFDAVCKQHDIPVPWTAFPASEQEAHAMASSLPYPVILKPKSHVGVGWARGQVVHTPQELRQAYHPYPVLPQRRMVMDRFPELRWPMIQEYVPGALKHLYSISGLLDDRGEICAAAGSQKTLQWPPTLGVGVLFESWNEPEAMQLGLAFVKAALGRGIFELEFILDARQNRYVAIDLNPRAHGHITFDLARGNDLPHLWYQLAKGATLPKRAPPKEGVRWLHAIPYHVGHWVGLVTGPSRLPRAQAYLHNMRGKTVDIINDVHDPLPSLAHTAYMFRHPGGLIKPFLREKV